MFGIQPLHLLVIVLVAFLIFGPKRLPELGRSLGQAINEFKAAGKELTDAVNSETQPSAPQVAPPPQSIAKTENGAVTETTEQPKS